MPSTWIMNAVSPEQRQQGWLIRQFPTYSYDNVDDVVSLAHPHQPLRTSGIPPTVTSQGLLYLVPPRGYQLFDAFERLCDRYFQWSGGELCIRENRMVELHELALRFPVAHLIRHAHARAVAMGVLSNARAVDLPEQMSLLNTNAYGLRSVVERGVAESHLHLWGVLSAEETWADHLLAHLSTRAVAPLDRDSGEAEWRLLSLGRFAVRLLALAVLHASTDASVSRLPLHLLALLDRMYLARTQEEEFHVRRELENGLRTAIGEALGLESRDDDPGGRATSDDDWLENTIDDPGRGARILIPVSCDHLMRILDPVVWHLSRRDHGMGHGQRESLRDRVRCIEHLHLATQEILLLLSEPSRNFSHEITHSNRGFFLEQAFFRYLVCQTHHWQMATQSGQTTGLRQFQAFYGALQRRTLNTGDSEAQNLILERLRRTHGLDIVEGRVAPPRRGIIDLQPWLLGYARDFERGELSKFGLVVHFIKDGLEESRRRGYPRGFPEPRHGRRRRLTRDHAVNLYRLLGQPHPLIPFLVGIDAASLELTTPPEVFAPVFRFLRDYPIEVHDSTRQWRYREVWPDIAELVKRRRLGMTYHVGEDFRHLLSGLRAIDEVLRFLAPHPGDRLGHAIALALDPEIWAEQTGYQAILSRLEWLDNLVWIYDLLGAGHPRVAELELAAQIQRLAREIYHVESNNHGDPTNTSPWSPGTASAWSPFILHDAWILRQLDPYSVNIDHLVRYGLEPASPGPGREVTTSPSNDAASGSPGPMRSPRPGPAAQRWWHIQKHVLTRLAGDVGAGDTYQLLGRYWYDDDVRQRGDQVMLVDMLDQKTSWLALMNDVQEKMQNKVHHHQMVVEINPSSNRIIGPIERLEDLHIFRLTLDEHGEIAPKLPVTINTDDPGVFNTSLAHEYYLLAEVLLDRGLSEPKVVQWLTMMRENSIDASFLHALPDVRDQHLERVIRALERCRSQSTGPRHDRDEQWNDFWQRRTRPLE